MLPFQFVHGDVFQPKENAKPTNSGVLVVSASIHTGNVISDAIAQMEAMKKAVLRR